MPTFGRPPNGLRSTATSPSTNPSPNPTLGIEWSALHSLWTQWAYKSPSWPYLPPTATRSDGPRAIRMVSGALPLAWTTKAKSWLTSRLNSRRMAEFLDSVEAPPLVLWSFAPGSQLRRTRCASILDGRSPADYRLLVRWPRYWLAMAAALGRLKTSFTHGSIGMMTRLAILQVCRSFLALDWLCSGTEEGQPNNTQMAPTTASAKASPDSSLSDGSGPTPGGLAANTPTEETKEGLESSSNTMGLTVQPPATLGQFNGTLQIEPLTEQYGPAEHTLLRSISMPTDDECGSIPCRRRPLGRARLGTCGRHSSIGSHSFGERSRRRTADWDRDGKGGTQKP